MSTTDTADLKALTDDELALLFADADEVTAKLITREMKRRDDKERKHKRDAARWQAVYDEWILEAHTQYLAAEATCCGNLVDKDAADAPADPFGLWTGTEEWAMRVATEELRDFWAIHPRQTVSQYRARLRAAKRDARATCAA